MHSGVRLHLWLLVLSLDRLAALHESVLSLQSSQEAPGADAGSLRSWGSDQPREEEEAVAGAGRAGAGLNLNLLQVSAATEAALEEELKPRAGDAGRHEAGTKGKHKGKARSQLRPKADLAAQHKAKAEAKSEHKGKGKLQPKADLAAQHKAKAGAKSEHKAKAEGKGQHKAKSGAAVEHKQVQQHKAKAEAKGQHKAKAEAASEHSAESKHKAKSGAAAEHKQVQQHKAKAGSKAEAKGQHKAKAKAEGQHRARAEAKAEEKARSEWMAEYAAKAEAERHEAEFGADTGPAVKAQHGRQVQDREEKAKARHVAKVEAHKSKKSSLKVKHEAGSEAESAAEVEVAAEAKAQARAKLNAARARATSTRRAKAAKAASEPDADIEGYGDRVPTVFDEAPATALARMSNADAPHDRPARPDDPDFAENVQKLAGRRADAASDWVPTWVQKKDQEVDALAQKRQSADGQERPADLANSEEAPAKNAEKGALAMPASPEAPGCYVWAPSGCPNQLSFVASTWQHDNFGEEFGGAKENQTVCESMRGPHFKHWCGAEDVRMLWIADATAEPQPEASALLSQEAPQTSGCYVQLAKGCPRHPTFKAQSWTIDPSWEVYEETATRQSCDQRGPKFAHWCGTLEGQVSMLFVQPQATGEASSKEQPSRPVSAVPAAPTEPGCYSFVPYGCPSHPQRTTTAWKPEKYPNAEKSQQVCESREHQLMKWCGTTEVKMLFVRDVLAEEKAEEEQSEQEKYGLPAEESAGATSAEQEGAMPPSVDAAYPEVPSEPGCYVFTPQGCPRSELFQKESTQRWVRDVYGEKHLNAGNDRAVCEGRGRSHYVSWCGTKSVELAFVPGMMDGPTSDGPGAVFDGPGPTEPAASEQKEEDGPGDLWVPESTAFSRMRGGGVMSQLAQKLAERVRIKDLPQIVDESADEQALRMADEEETYGVTAGAQAANETQPEPKQEQQEAPSQPAAEKAPGRVESLANATSSDSSAADAAALEQASQQDAQGRADRQPPGLDAGSPLDDLEVASKPTKDPEGAPPVIDTDTPAAPAVPKLPEAPAVADTPAPPAEAGAAVVTSPPQAGGEDAAAKDLWEAKNAHLTEKEAKEEYKRIRAARMAKEGKEAGSGSWDPELNLMGVGLAVWIVGCIGISEARRHYGLKPAAKR